MRSYELCLAWFCELSFRWRGDAHRFATTFPNGDLAVAYLGILPVGQLFKMRDRDSVGNYRENSNS